MSRITRILFVVLSLCFVTLISIWLYFQKSLEQFDPESSYSDRIFSRHYFLIADEKDSLLWQSIIQSAQKEAEQADAYLEVLYLDDQEGYTQEECLEIGIAAGVDGIILKPDGSPDCQDLIRDAAEAGIPVVTMIEDDSQSERITFVGQNTYQMGEAYADQILSLPDQESSHLLVLMDAASRSQGTNLICSQILKELEAAGKTVQMTEYPIDQTADFNTEEVIRDIFINTEELPDIMICLDEVITECVYQALVDYNKVGDVELIGFYYSDTILEAIQRGSMTATIFLDAEQIGRCCIAALDEYISLGHTSDYYSVDLKIITRENAAAYQQTA